MLFARKALGLEISHEGVAFALTGGTRNVPRLDAYLTAPLPVDTLRFSLREPNVQNPAAFVDVIRNGYLRLLTPVKRVSLSLPDAIGRVLLLDLETRFRSRDEGADIIRWKLKKSLPFDVTEVHLDYQVLKEKETGEVATLVALISRRVLNQYEELLVQAGLEPNRIDFSTFNFYNLCAHRLELDAYSAFMAFHGRTVSILIFSDGVLEFYRAKELPGHPLDADRVFREISSSLLVHQEKYPAHTPTKVFVSAAMDEAEIFRAVVAEATGLEPVSLDMDRLITRKDGLNVERGTLHLLAGAIGAATRNL
jgi:type IV pilus assembly protein PilM